MARVTMRLTAMMIVVSARGHDVFCGQSPEDARHIAHVAHRSSPGDTIIIHGTCLLTDIVPLLGDRTYQGVSRTGTILTQPDGRHLDALMGSDSWLMMGNTSGTPITLERLTLDGNRAGNQRTHGVVIRSWLTTLTNMYITNCPGDGVRLDAVARDGLTQLTNTQVNSYFTNLFIEHITGTGFHVVDPTNAITDSYLTESWISDSGKSAVYLENAAGWTVERVHTYDSGEHAIFGDRCSGTAINGNYIEDFGSVGGEESVVWFGIACGVQSAGSYGATTMIANNRVWTDMRGKYNVDNKATLANIGVPRLNVCEVEYCGGSRGQAFHPVGEITVVNNNIRGANRLNSIGEFYAAVIGDRNLGHSIWRSSRRDISGVTLNVFTRGNTYAGVAHKQRIDRLVYFDEGSDPYDNNPSKRTDICCNLTTKDSIWKESERWPQ